MRLPRTLDELMPILARHGVTKCRLRVGVWGGGSLDLEFGAPRLTPTIEEHDARPMRAPKPDAVDLALAPPWHPGED